LDGQLAELKRYKSNTGKLTSGNQRLVWQGLCPSVCQIIKAVRWENEFKSEGVANLADFSALVSELEALDPVLCAVHPGNRRSDGWVPQQLQPPNVVQFAKKLDGLLELLDVTADALAATWDQVSGGEKLDAPRWAAIS